MGFEPTKEKPGAYETPPIDHSGTLLCGEDWNRTNNTRLKRLLFAAGNLCVLITFFTLLYQLSYFPNKNNMSMNFCHPNGTRIRIFAVKERLPKPVSRWGDIKIKKPNHFLIGFRLKYLIYLLIRYIFPNQIFYLLHFFIYFIN